MWIGAIVGFLLGTLFLGGFEAGVVLAIVGGIVGFIIKSNQDKFRDPDLQQSEWRSPASTSSTKSSESLESRFKKLQRDFQDMHQRMIRLEADLFGRDEEAAAADEPEVTETQGIEDVPAPPVAATVAAKSIPAVEKTIEAPVHAAEPQAPPEPVEPVQHETEDTGHDPYDSKPAPRKFIEPPKPPEPPAPPPEPTLIQTFIKRWVIGGNPLVKVGVLILFLGLGFLLRYVAERAVFPIELRYIAVATVGIGLLVLGWRWRERADSYGLTMQGAGIGILYLTTLAAMKLHPVLSPDVGFPVLVAVAAFAAFLAIRQDALIMAVVAALCGFAAPVLASTGSGNHIALFSYLTILNFGIVSIAWFKSWRALNIIGYVCSFSLGGTWAAQYYRDDLFSTTEPFLLLLFGLYVLVTFLFARRTLADAPENSSPSLVVQVQQASKHVKYVDGTLAFGVPFSAFWVQQMLVEPYEYGAAISAVGFGLFYFLLAFLLINRTGRRYFLLTETLIALGVVFCTLAIPLLEQPWTAAAWGAEAAGVYWIGYRQRQVHARIFALLLLFGSAFYFMPELGWSPGGTVLDGSVLSSALLTLGTGVTYWLMWRAEPGRLHRYEESLRPFVAGFGAFILATIPLLLFSRDWASPALAVLGGGLIYLSIRMSDRPAMISGWVYQLVGGLLFLTTLDTGPGASVLANGWAGLFATCLIGGSMLLGTWIIAPNVLSGASGDSQDEPEALSAPAYVALLSGMAFINLAPMMVLSWRMSAMIWPLIGIATLIWAVRTRRLGITLFALGLQVLAGLAHLYSRTFSAPALSRPDDVTPFLNSEFLGPAIISLAALGCAWFVQREKRRDDINVGMGWIALGWSGLWWAFAWVSEIHDVAPAGSITACLVGITLATAWAWTELSRRLDWPQPGLAAFAYVPVLVLLAIAANLGDSPHPLASWGALAWPAALLMHAFLLWRQKSQVPNSLIEFAHIIGAWLFLVQATLEAQWWIAEWSNAASAWPLFGWVVVPTLYLFSMTRPFVQSRWPVREYAEIYTMRSVYPVIVYLLGWVFLTNMFSNGSAHPLPYIPLLNPLEIAYVAILFGASLWWRPIRTQDSVQSVAPAMKAVLRGAAFVSISAGVVRACHHWAGIPWRFDDLMSADLVQTSLSIVWSILAIAYMVLGHRRQSRAMWITGAALMAVVVVKLFLVELSASGSLERIVSFIVVGLLLLFVGYVAPLPPRLEEPARQAHDPD